jgi:hypothetical protein
VFYQDDSGFDLEAQPAEEWLKIQGDLDKRKAKDVGYQQGNVWFGIALLAVGLVLAAFGAWLLMDVRQVRREGVKDSEDVGGFLALPSPYSLALGEEAAEAEKAAAAKAAPVQPIMVDPTPGGPAPDKT